ncbi:MAG: PorT family protein [Bacteroidaceae bacterium]|nr:PorT family protein [Bacteroidaceae bacterium]
MFQIQKHIKFTILLLLLTFNICVVKAQIGDYRNDMCVGVNVGVTMNEVGFEPLIAQKMLTQPTIGLTFRYTSEKFLTAYCAFQTELNYARLGWKEDIMNSKLEPLPDTYERTIDYLQMPFLARLAWGKEHKGTMFYFLLGPQIGYVISDHAKKSDTWTTKFDGSADRPNSVVAQYDLAIKNKFEYGITGGVGVELNTSIGHFLVEGRYYYGLADIFGNSKRDFFSRSNHTTIVAKVSYLVDL